MIRAGHIRSRNIDICVFLWQRKYAIMLCNSEQLRTFFTLMHIFVSTKSAGLACKRLCMHGQAIARYENKLFAKWEVG